jgi:hypothetical protein
MWEKKEDNLGEKKYKKKTRKKYEESYSTFPFYVLE